MPQNILDLGAGTGVWAVREGGRLSAGDRDQR